jgi:hypothetical protein
MSRPVRGPFNLLESMDTLIDMLVEVAGKSVKVKVLRRGLFFGELLETVGDEIIRLPRAEPRRELRLLLDNHSQEIKKRGGKYQAQSIIKQDRTPTFKVRVRVCDLVSERRHPRTLFRTNKEAQSGSALRGIQRGSWSRCKRCYMVGLSASPVTLVGICDFDPLTAILRED